MWAPPVPLQFCVTLGQSFGCLRDSSSRAVGGTDRLGGAGHTLPTHPAASLCLLAPVMKQAMVKRGNWPFPHFSS